MKKPVTKPKVNNGLNSIDDEEFDSLNADSLHLYSLNYQNSVVIHEDEVLDIESMFGNYDNEVLSFKERMQKLYRDRKIVSGFTEMAQKSLSNNKQTAALNKKKDLLTMVPFLLYEAKRPNMRNISETYLKYMDYSNWTETQFFKAA